jgi:hypothetical protein
LAVNLVIVNGCLGASIECKIRNGAMAKDRQSLASKHYREMKVLRETNTTQVADIEQNNISIEHLNDDIANAETLASKHFKEMEVLRRRNMILVADIEQDNIFIEHLDSDIVIVRAGGQHELKQDMDKLRIEVARGHEGIRHVLSHAVRL